MYSFLYFLGLVNMFDMKMVSKEIPVNAFHNEFIDEQV